jgi:Flp pilus assembly protein TadG
VSCCSRRCRRSGRRGQGLVEFAIVAPVLIVLVFGVFDFGRAMSANVTVANSSREGARYLIANAVTQGSTSYSSCQSGTNDSTPPSSTSAEGKAWRQLQSDGLDLTKVGMAIYFYKSTNDPANDTSSTHSAADMSVTCAAGSTSSSPTIPTTTYSPASGDWVLFTATYVYRPVTPVVSQMLSGGTMTLTQTTTMVIE